MIRFRYCIGIVLVGALLGFPYCLPAGQVRDPARMTPSAGEEAPDFTLRDFQGRRFTLSDRKGHEGTLLWFTNLCEGCRSKFAEMEKLKSEYSGRGVEVIALSQLGKDRKTVEEAIRSNHLTLRFLYDPDGDVTTLYAGRYAPGTCPLTNLYVVDGDGMITYATHYPGVPESEIRKRVAQLGKATPKGSG